MAKLNQNKEKGDSEMIIKKIYVCIREIIANENI